MSSMWWGLHDTLVPLDSTYSTPIHPRSDLQFAPTWQLAAQSQYVAHKAYTVYVPIDAHCASADLRVRVYFKKKCKKKKVKNIILFF